MHDHALARCAHGGVGGLGVDTLGRLDAVDLLDSREIVARKATGRLHTHAERGDDHDGQEALKTAADCAVDATAKNRRHHIV